MYTVDVFLYVLETRRSLKRFFISKCLSFVVSYGNFSAIYNNLLFAKEVHSATSRFKSQVTLLKLLLSLCSFTFQQLKERIKTIASLPISKTNIPEVIQLTAYYCLASSILKQLILILRTEDPLPPHPKTICCCMAT